MGRWRRGRVAGSGEASSVAGEGVEYILYLSEIPVVVTPPKLKPHSEQREEYTHIIYVQPPSGQSLANHAVKQEADVKQEALRAGGRRRSQLEAGDTADGRHGVGLCREG